MRFLVELLLWCCVAACPWRCCLFQDGFSDAGDILWSDAGAKEPNWVLWRRRELPFFVIGYVDMVGGCVHWQMFGYRHEFIHGSAAVCPHIYMQISLINCLLSWPLAVRLSYLSLCLAGWDPNYRRHRGDTEEPNPQLQRLKSDICPRRVLTDT